MPARVTQLTGVACPSTRVCFAVGGELGGAAVLASRDGAASWTLTAPRGGFLQAISCPSPVACMAVSDGPGVSFLTTRDGGRTWNPKPGGAQLRISDILSLSCVSAEAASR